MIVLLINPKNQKLVCTHKFDDLHTACIEALKMK